MTLNKHTCFEFMEGPIPSPLVADWLQKGNAHHDAGAYSVFMGQVRNDVIDNKTVRSIDYSANKILAEEVMTKIFQDSETAYNSKLIHVVHSLGEVSKGEICLLVLVVCKHRKESFSACEYIVERLKKELPVWGKEIFEDDSHIWKVNK